MPMLHKAACLFSNLQSKPGKLNPLLKEYGYLSGWRRKEWHLCSCDFA